MIYSKEFPTLKEFSVKSYLYWSKFLHLPRSSSEWILIQKQLEKGKQVFQSELKFHKSTKEIIFYSIPVPSFSFQGLLQAPTWASLPGTPRQFWLCIGQFGGAKLKISKQNPSQSTTMLRTSVWRQFLLPAIAPDPKRASHFRAIFASPEPLAERENIKITAITTAHHLKLNWYCKEKAVFCSLKQKWHRQSNYQQQENIFKAMRIIAFCLWYP